MPRDRHPMAWSSFGLEDSMEDAKNEAAPEPYEPPTVADVPLRAEEQLLAGCKNPTTGGPSAFRCFTLRGPCRVPRGS